MSALDFFFSGMAEEIWARMNIIEMFILDMGWRPREGRMAAFLVFRQLPATSWTQTLESLNDLHSQNHIFQRNKKKKNQILYQFCSAVTAFPLLVPGFHWGLILFSVYLLASLTNTYSIRLILHELLIDQEVPQSITPLR